MDGDLKKFSNNLQKLPACNNSDYYRWADYFELKAIANSDGFYSKSDFTNEEPKRADDLGEGDFEENKEIKELPNSKKNDRWEQIADDIFRNIETRVKMFGNFYPFEISKTGVGLQYNGATSIQHEYYIFLLYCSNLAYTGHTPQLTSSFEKVCEAVLSKILSPNADVMLFGSSNIDNEWKTTKLWDKLTWLSEFLKADLLAKEDDIGKYDKGDRGLDLVARVAFDDGISQFPTYFGQCACSPDQWQSKQLSIHPAAWASLLNLNNLPAQMIFIPQSFRNSQGNWHDKHDISQSILIDRYRILKHMIDEDTFKKLSAYPIMNKLLTFKESSF